MKITTKMRQLNTVRQTAEMMITAYTESPKLSWISLLCKTTRMEKIC